MILNSQFIWLVTKHIFPKNMGPLKFLFLKRNSLSSTGRSNMFSSSYVYQHHWCFGNKWCNLLFRYYLGEVQVPFEIWDHNGHYHLPILLKPPYFWVSWNTKVWQVTQILNQCLQCQPLGNIPLQHLQGIHDNSSCHFYITHYYSWNYCNYNYGIHEILMPWST